MIERQYTTTLGDIHYWVGESMNPEALTLVFLPGLTADHRLFDKQIAYFETRYNVFVWDAPGHASSYPFRMDFDLMNKAEWLHEILAVEHIIRPVIVGQSMGGYVGQAFAEKYPAELCGFISVDSAPLQRKYVTAAEIWLLKRMAPVYRHYPWKSLLHSGSKGVSTSEYGRKLMLDMMMVYDGNQNRYAELSGHGYKILAQAMEADLPYEINCPALLICGEKDRAGSTKAYNKAWHRRSGLPLCWIPDAGHNSNTDAPQTVNAIIEEFLRQIP